MPGIPSVVQGDVFVAGSLAASAMKIPTGAISDTNMASGGGANGYVAAEKVRRQPHIQYAQPNVATVSETKPIYRCNGTTGQVLSVWAGSIAANIGAATVTVDVKKNGVSILTAPITLNNSNAARTLAAGTLAGAGAPNMVAGDFLEVVVVATAGGGTLATGLLVQIIADEDPQ